MGIRMDQQRKPCTRCLLRDMGEEEAYRIFKRYLDSFDEEIRVEEEEYERRLALCRQCGSLRDGICGKCGCYVEARALHKEGACPHEDPRW